MLALVDDPGVEQVFCDRSLERVALAEWIRRSPDQSFNLTDAMKDLRTLESHAIPLDDYLKRRGV